jgi:MscS family membrane protein
MKRLLHPENCLRLALLSLVGILLWTAWPARAAEATNAPAATTNAVVPLTSTLDSFAREHAETLSFGLNHIPALQGSFLGHPVWQYLATFIFVAFAFYVSKFVDWFIHSRLKKWAERTETEWDDILINLLDGPVKVIVFVLLVHVGLAIFDWNGLTEVWVSKITTLIVAFAILTVVLRAVDAVIEIWKQGQTGNVGEKAFNDHFLVLMGKLGKGIIVVVATLTTLAHLGFDIKAALASVSVIGLALGLAAQDTVSNLFGAVSVFVDKPFQIGDRIRVGDVDGNVEEMGLRSTRIRSLDGFLITVPNKTVGNTTIVNLSRRPTIKTELNFGVTYDTPAERVRLASELLLEIFQAHPETHDVMVNFNKFLDSSLNLQVVHWWRGTDPRANLTALQQLNLEVKRRFDAAGLDFAFPSQTVYHRPEPDWKAPARPHAPV